MEIYNTTLDEFVKVFFQFLKKEKAYGNFKKALYRDNYFKKEPNYGAFFKRNLKEYYIDNRHPTDCLFSIHLFCLWIETPEGYKYWAKLYLKWLSLDRKSVV